MTAIVVLVVTAVASFGATLVISLILNAVDERRYEKEHPGYREWKNQR